MLTRRKMIKTGGLALAGLVLPRCAVALSSAVEIRTKSDDDGARVWFDPIGVLVTPGTLVRWVNDANVHTATAYHPANDCHALRIPAQATPWDSDYLINPGDSFAVTLLLPGVYDYFCAPHEAAGMVGRIVVADTGQGLAEPMYETALMPAGSCHKATPVAARRAFPSVAEIIAKGRVFA